MRRRREDYRRKELDIFGYVLISWNKIVSHNCINWIWHDSINPSINLQLEPDISCYFTLASSTSNFGDITIITKICVTELPCRMHYEQIQRISKGFASFYMTIPVFKCSLFLTLLDKTYKKYGRISVSTDEQTSKQKL